MTRTKAISLAVVALLAAFIGYLAMRGRQPPMLPVNEEHAPSVSLDECLLCHGPDGVLPQTTNHPLGNDCRRCHGNP